MSELMHFEIETRDPERTMSLYAALFGWTYEEAMEGYWMIRTGQKGEPTGAIMASSEERSRTINVFAVEDIRAYAAKASRLPGMNVGDVMTIPGVGLFAYCDDPFGMRFGVLQAQ